MTNRTDGQGFMIWSYVAFQRLLVMVLSIGMLQVRAVGQQSVSRGPFGRPNQVLDETGQWTTPLLVASDRDVEIYVPDLTSPDWLKLNYQAYHDRGTYTISVFTFYRTPKACQINQTGWGLGDKDHLNACLDIGYRIRRARINQGEKSATLLMAAMIGQDGIVDPDSIQTQQTFRLWNQLDDNSRVAIERIDALVTRQMLIYDSKVQKRR